MALLKGGGCTVDDFYRDYNCMRFFLSAPSALFKISAAILPPPMRLLRIVGLLVGKNPSFLARNLSSTVTLSNGSKPFSEIPGRVVWFH